MPKLAVLVSGTGSILEAILEAEIPVTLVVADRDCRAVRVAHRFDVLTAILNRTDFSPQFARAAYTERLASVLQDHGITLVALAGFMTVLDASMFEVYGGRIYNTHPSLLPAFKGSNAVRDAMEYGVQVTGCTIHKVTEEFDAGPIIAQEAVKVEPQDTEASLHGRIKQVERRLYPKVIKQLMAHD